MHWRRQRHEFRKQKQSLILTTHCKTYRCHWCKQKKYCRFVQDGSFHVPFGCQMLFRLCWHWTTKFITSIEAHEFDTWGYGPMYIYVYHSRHKWWWFQYRTFESESSFFWQKWHVSNSDPWTMAHLIWCAICATIGYYLKCCTTISMLLYVYRSTIGGLVQASQLCQAVRNDLQTKLANAQDEARTVWVFSKDLVHSFCCHVDEVSI